MSAAIHKSKGFAVRAVLCAAAATTPARLCVLMSLGVLGLSLPIAAETWVIENARIATQSAQGTLAKGALVIEDGLITGVGPQLALPAANAAGVQRIDAGGRWVTPGLIESYSQIGLLEISAETSTVDAAVVEYPMGPAFDVSYALNPDSVLLPLARSWGLTSAIVAPRSGNDLFAGWGALLQLGLGTPLSKPRLALFGNMGTSASAFVGGSRAALLIKLRQSLTSARRYNANRYIADERGYTNADMAALKVWLNSDTPLALQVNQAHQISQALALAKELRFPLIIIGGAEAWKVASELAAADVPVVIDPMENVPLGFDRLGARLDNAALLHEAGVRVAFTAESSHNAAWIRQGAGIAVANGLPFDVALAAITATPAAIWGLENLGSLARGKRADLVIWSGDPLEVTSHAERVMIGGEWQSLTTRAGRLRDRYRDLSNTTTPFGYR